jgi:hypothetical protein
LTDPPTVWQALGISPTREIGDIRRAYAARLKECHPEENPEGFQRLRAAYEAALSAARGATDATGPLRPTAVAEAVAQEQPQTSSSGAISSQPADEDQRHFEGAIGRLEQLLKTPEQRDPATLDAALNVVLDSPGAFHVGTWSALERRLARVLIETVPKSDAILETVVQRLGWARADVMTARAKEVVAVVTRVADLATVAKLRSGSDADALAFQLFSRPAPNSWLVRRLRALHLDRAVRHFFNETLKSRPTLTQWLDKTSVDTWLKIFGQPRVTARGLVAMPILSAVAVAGAYIAGVFEVLPRDWRDIAFLVALCVGPGLVLLKLYAFSWPVTLLLRRLKGKPPRWIRWSWLPAAVVSVLLVSSLPAGWPAAALSFVLSAGLLVWATVASYPVFVAEGLGFYQRLKLVLMENPLVLFWTCIVGWSVGVAACITTVGAFGASAIAGRSLGRMWKFDCPSHLRHWSLVALSLVPAAAVYVLWWNRESPLQVGFGTGLVTVAALVQRPVRLSLSQALMGRWLQTMVFVTFGFIFVVPYVVSTNLVNTQQGAVRLAATYVLIGVVANICLVVFSEATTSRLFRRASAQA